MDSTNEISRFDLLNKNLELEMPVLNCQPHPLAWISQ